MNPPKKFKGKSVTFEQKQALVLFMQEHPELHKGKFSPSFTHKNCKDLWTQIGNELNSIVGATKDPSKWKKVSKYSYRYLIFYFIVGTEHI